MRRRRPRKKVKEGSKGKKSRIEVKEERKEVKEGSHRKKKERNEGREQGGREVKGERKE